MIMVAVKDIVYGVGRNFEYTESVFVVDVWFLFRMLVMLCLVYHPSDRNHSKAILLFPRQMQMNGPIVNSVRNESFLVDRDKAVS